MANLNSALAKAERTKKAAQEVEEIEARVASLEQQLRVLNNKLSAKRGERNALVAELKADVASLP